MQAWGVAEKSVIWAQSVVVGLGSRVGGSTEVTSIYVSCAEKEKLCEHGFGARHYTN